MWFKTILRRKPAPRPAARADADEGPLFDEGFLRRMERLSLQAQRGLRGNPASGEHPSRRLLPTSVFSEHRPYSSGDDLRYVDWNAYARHNSVLLKLGEAEQDVNVHLLIDTSKSMAWGRPSKLRVAQRLVGALGYLALAHSDRLQITPLSGGGKGAFGPAQGKGRLVELLRYIGGLQPRPETDLGGALARLARGHERGGIAVVASDLLAAEGLEAGLARLTPPRWQVLVLHILDPRELRPELEGPLELEDSETGQRLSLTLDGETLAEYRRNLARWREGLAEACARRGATYAQILTPWPIERKIVPYLRARRLLG